MVSSCNDAACFALLDDCDADAHDPRSRLYTDYVATLSCRDAAGLPDLVERLQASLGQGLHAVCVFSYELGAELHRIPARTGQAELAHILLFKRCQRLSSQEVGRWLEEQEHAAQSNTPAGVAAIQASVDQPRFAQAIDAIRAYIEAGDTYQTNYTYRLRFDAFGSPLALYRRLRLRQPVPYGALIAMPDGEAILSLSPELFVRHDNGMLTARPMKGTAPASGDDGIDASRSVALASDEKNRAENLMIVDLLRNDLGRVATPGSVRVPKLFSVDRFSSVLQMTSTIQAELRKDADLCEVLTALYPCGSITGAPKRRTMQIIRELEDDARGIYTGAIGWFDAPEPGTAVGNFCLSVPIRTLVLQAQDDGATRKGEMGVGAGIVYDSRAAEEFAECQLKAGFLTGLSNDFELFETMYATRDGGCRHLTLHLQRLRASAIYFGFAWNEDAVRAALRQACDALPSDIACRVRLGLTPDGQCRVQSAVLTDLPPRVQVVLATQATDSRELFLRHKTTVRERYDAAWRYAETRGAFDMLFFNEKGELTEGGRSNVFVRLDGRWVTPPLHCGLLPGVMRSVLLSDSDWHATEQVVTIDDLLRADELVVCNALRGALPASLLRD
ncbi:aminodeoxychorismate synthase component I [Noviherbaspirillum saxi]|uniref:Aminodeoxychorismate synthase component I n=1 Tax=Noviherbaspirillum saxi TaxID=2320863 RepID=A0A3A3FW92_9BURK|nr:aminodeoxychorismate synthase component I [Noviherbaspirillum saxi]